jgi:serine/threonine protein kinase
MSVGNVLPKPDDIILDRYVVREEIGRGGFGVVYKAMQTGLERTVALKMLLPSAMVREEMVERFRREAVLARNLNHPNTIRLYDFGQTKTGLLFIAMEYLEGKPLDDVLDQGPMELERVKHIGIQILKSLAEAHQHNVIHRDIKPSNIFICDNVVGEQDFAKVLDFGIAKAFGEKESSRLTQTGVGFGTPSYMAPEQVRGKDICPATDLYSLGLLMAEMLTGDKIYTGDSSMDVAIKQVSDQPPPMPEWVLRGPLGSVLQRATQKSIHQRYPSAVEMLRDLRSVDSRVSIDVSTKLNSKDIPAEGPRDASESKMPMMVALAAVVFLLLVGVGVGGVLMFNIFGTETAEVVETKEKTPTVKKATASKKVKKKDDKGKKKIDAVPAEEGVAKVKLSIKSDPSGASVHLGEEYLGTTPVVLPMEVAQKSITLEVGKEGFKKQSLAILPDKDGDYEVKLEPAAKEKVGAGAQKKESGKRKKEVAVKKKPAVTKRNPKPAANKGTTKKTEKTPKKDTGNPGKIVIPRLD